jgi:hypothetical protein
MADVSMPQSTFAALLLTQFRPTDDGSGSLPRWPPKLGWPLESFTEQRQRSGFPAVRSFHPLSTPLDDAIDVLNRVVLIADVAAIEGSEKGLASIDRNLTKFVDDYCGTPPRKWPWRPPPRPLDYLLIGAVLQRRSEDFQGELLGKRLTKASAEFFRVGLERLAKEMRA